MKSMLVLALLAASASSALRAMQLPVFTPPGGFVEFKPVVSDDPREAKHWHNGNQSIELYVETRLGINTASQLAAAMMKNPEGSPFKTTISEVVEGPSHLCPHADETIRLRFRQTTHLNKSLIHDGRKIILIENIGGVTEGLEYFYSVDTKPNEDLVRFLDKSCL